MEDVTGVSDPAHTGVDRDLSYAFGLRLLAIVACVCCVHDVFPVCFVVLVIIPAPLGISLNLSISCKSVASPTLDAKSKPILRIQRVIRPARRVTCYPLGRRFIQILIGRLRSS